MRWDEIIVFKARKLRQRGKTYSEINSLLGIEVPKSTFNYWFRDLILPESYNRKIKKTVVSW